MFKESFKRLPFEKAKTHRKKVSSNPTYDEIILITMRDYLKEYIVSDQIIVRPSVGR